MRLQQDSLLTFKLATMTRRGAKWIWSVVHMVARRVNQGRRPSTKQAQESGIWNCCYCRAKCRYSSTCSRAFDAKDETKAYDLNALWSYRGNPMNSFWFDWLLFLAFLVRHFLKVGLAASFFYCPNFNDVFSKRPFFKIIPNTLSSWFLSVVPKHIRNSHLSF